MHILFYHQNYPAQFGPLVRQLVARPDWTVSFVSKDGQPDDSRVRHLRYRPIGGATARTHYAARTFENFIAHSHGAFAELAKQPDLKPDLIVGHSGFGSTTFLRDLFPCPQVNYFEYFYRVRDSDLDFRPDQPAAPIDRFRARARNAGLLLDLENCDAGYAPTHWQRDRLPALYHEKIRVIFDGIDGTVWQPGAKTPRTAGRFTIPSDLKIVTYVARGLESIRGFDVFMRMAKSLYQRRNDVRFVVVGSDRIHYGGDEKRTGGKSFKQWVLEQDTYELDRFAFLGSVPPSELARLFQLTDLHVYLTVPFVLSWSLFNAMACGAIVLGSDTGPVRELIEPGQTGLLHDFFDPEGMAERADRILGNPAEYAALGRAAAEHIRERYSVDVCLPKQIALFEQTASAGT
jgi:glycosyltransferase involved in cell wall biosynthesis